MISILSGIVMTGAGGASLWYFMPRNGVIHPLARKTLLDSIIPIGIVTALAVGVALMVAGVVT